MLTEETLAGIENQHVGESLVKAQAVLLHHKRVSVSISGGSDSDIVLDIIEKAKNEDNEITYVWFDTGVEYQATKDHLVYLENRYGIEIKRLRAQKTIPTCCREYGQPFLSKFTSEQMGRLQAHGFQWEDEPYETLAERYPNCMSALKWWTSWYTAESHNEKQSQFDICRFKWLKEFIIQNPPTFRISSNCCHYAKKNTAVRWQKESDADLTVFGVRKAEGGIRAAVYSSCYTHDTNNLPSYRPVFWYTDDDKRYYEEHFGIVHSACYTKYGLTRTGCVGCPYGRRVFDEHNQVEPFEPKLIKACRKMFADSYEYTRKYREFYAVMQDNQKHQIDGQTTIYDYIN